MQTLPYKGTVIVQKGSSAPSDGERADAETGNGRAGAVSVSSSLSLSESKVIALVMPLPTYLLASLAHGIEGELRKQGMRLQVCGSIPPGHADLQQYGQTVERYEAEALQSLAHDGLAGVIWWSIFGNANRDTARQLQSDGLPIVLVDNLVPELECDWVGIDDFGAAVQATEHLLEHGHSDIAFLADSAADYIYLTASHRLSGFLDTMQRAFPQRYSFDATLSGTQHFTYRNELSALPAPVRGQVVFEDEHPMETLLAHSPRPTAVVVGNDHLAYRFICALESQDIRVPQEIAVVSFGDIDRYTGRYSTLTTVRQPFEQIGQRAVHLLMSRLREPSRPVQHVHLATRLIVRETCGAVDASEDKGTRVRALPLASTPMVSVR